MKKTLLMFTVVSCLSGWLQAAPCAMGQLSTYDAVSFSCTLNGLTFSGFTYTNPAFGGATAPPDTGVNVTPITSGFGSEIGLLFNAAWLVSSNQGEDSAITFTVACNPGCTDAELVTVGGASGTGSASVSEGSGSPPALSLFSPNSGSDSATFPSVDTFTVRKDIGLSGGTDGSAHISFVYNLFSQPGTPPTPEPSLLLLCMGFVALVPVARWKWRKMSR